MKDNMKERD